MEQQTAVITGGAGFLGSHLCDFLLEHGYRVVCVDNLITGRLANIEHLSSNRLFKFIEQDVCEGLKIRGQVDFVLHFASLASPVDYAEHPIETLKVGSLGTLNALELAHRKRAVFMMASTSEVYGDPLQNPQKEEYWGNVNPVGPRSMYDESKRFAEALTMAYHRKLGVNTRIVRIFNTYGPRMKSDDGRIVPNLITQALTGRPMTIYGDGKQTRSFCYVSDLIQGIYKLMKTEFHEPVNLGNPNEMNMLELARVVRGITGTEGKLVFKPMPGDDPKRRRPDISKAQTILGWSPKISLQQGLTETIRWFSDELNTD
ncbi:MAG: UDP-glucuronic acid decarboxylase family protein [Dehalococcoidia bacterium]|jgi:dTDP-glucose 4,6-dehydratase